jgi:NAD-dependent SIR2 family protein deacetylase
MNDAATTEAIRRAAQAIAAADALMIGAGAGMGVDSGLPDFRGNEGFWNAYPPFRRANLTFAEVANPAWFRTKPRQAWGFYGHRLNLYRGTSPHAGFEILKRWTESKPAGRFVFTSNVDGHFQRAGFDDERIVECHGSIDRLQCATPCGSAIWSADEIAPVVDETDFQAAEPLPQCPACGGVARPNILMFGDSRWLESRTVEQETRFERWRAKMNSATLAVVELGAGLAIPTIRRLCERVGGTLIRINPREPQTPPGGISIPLGALEALTAIDAVISSAL